MNAINTWVNLSSGTFAEGEGTNVPGALLNLLKNLGELAEAASKLIGLVA